MQQVYERRILTASADKWGYQTLHIGWKGNRVRVRLHHMVLLAFKGQRPSPRHECLHADHDPSNNRPGNLRWGTNADNAADRKRAGRYAVGARHHAAVLTESQARAIIADPRPYSALVRDFGISKSQVARLKKGLAWSHLSSPKGTPTHDAR